TPKPLTANRNNDRWPVLTQGQLVVFSLWSRNREAITADGRDVVPWTAGGAYANRPTDIWMGARLLPDGTQFGYTLKLPIPVWRQRPLFNGKLAFMTSGDGPGRRRIAQAGFGQVRPAARG